MEQKRGCLPDKIQGRRISTKRNFDHMCWPNIHAYKSWTKQQCPSHVFPLSSQWDP